MSVRVITFFKVPTRTARIAELASFIQEKTTILDEYFAAQGLPSPSYDEPYPATVQLPDDIAKTRDAVTEANDELRTLLMGPSVLDVLRNRKGQSVSS